MLANAVLVTWPSRQTNKTETESMGVSSCNLLHTSMGFFTVHLFQGKGFSLVLGSALTKNCFLQAVWHHQTPSRGLFVCQGEESLMGTLKAKQIKRDWTRLPSPKKNQKKQKSSFIRGAVKSRPGSVLFVRGLKSSWQLLASCCEDTGQVATWAVTLLISVENSEHVKTHAHAHSLRVVSRRLELHGLLGWRPLSV